MATTSKIGLQIRVPFVRCARHSLVVTLSNYSFSLFQTGQSALCRSVATVAGVTLHLFVSLFTCPLLSSTNLRAARGHAHALLCCKLEGAFLLWSVFSLFCMQFPNPQRVELPATVQMTEQGEARSRCYITFPVLRHCTECFSLNNRDQERG